jgi:hypothetical protein
MVIVRIAVVRMQRIRMRVERGHRPLK